MGVSVQRGYKKTIQFDNQDNSGNSRHLTDEVDDDGYLEVGAHLDLLHDPGVLLQELAGGVVGPLCPHAVPSAEPTRIVWRKYRLKVDIVSISIFDCL